MDVERRPHWDTELIEATRKAIFERPLYDEDVYAIIAAVEDWQDARGDAIDGRSLTEAVFAVQRVRAIIAEGQKDRGWGHDDDFDAGWDRCANDILRALDGDSDE